MVILMFSALFEIICVVLLGTIWGACPDRN